MKSIIVKALHTFLQTAAAVLILTYQHYATGVHVSIGATAQALVPALAAAAAVLYHGVPALLTKAQATKAAKFEAAVTAAIAARATAIPAP